MLYASIALSALIWLYLIYRYDKYEPEPVLVLLAVGILGGIISSIPAALFNGIAGYLTGAERMLDSGITGSAVVPQYFRFAMFVGFNEEFWKAAATVLLVKKLKDFNEPIDGLIYSMSVALGFAALENIEYTMAGGMFNLVLRSLTAVPMHIGLAAIWGAGISRAKYLKGGRYFSTLVPYVVTAALVHALYNFIQFVMPPNIYLLPVAMVFALVLTASAARRLKKYQRLSPFR